MAIPNHQSTKIASGTPEARRTLFKALFRIKDFWQLNDTDFARLVHVDKTSISKWRDSEEVPDKTRHAEVIKSVLALHRSLGSMFSDEKDQMLWLKTAHPNFGRPPLDIAQESMEGLFRMRRYVDFIRGRGA